MLKAVQDGSISLPGGRILVPDGQVRYLEHPTRRPITDIDYAYNAPILQKTAEHAATLLKNQNSVLPLSAADLAVDLLHRPTSGILVSVGVAG